MYKPLRDFIIVKADQPEKVGGVFDMPQIVMSKPLTGVVHAVGSGIDGKTMKTAVGDRIMYKQYAGWEVEIDGEIYMRMSEINDVLCII